MKRTNVVICILLTIIIGLIFGKALMSEVSKATSVSVMSAQQQLGLWRDENNYYLFLPSYVNPAQVLWSQESDELELPDLQQHLHCGDALDKLPINEPIKCMNQRNQEEFTLTIMQSANLPTIYIDTKSGTMDNIYADKEYKEKAKMKIVDEQGNLQYERSLDFIKGRGNASWRYYDKKSVSLGLKDEASLLDLAKGEKWVLCASACDDTLLRNEITYGLAEKLNLEHTQGGRFVDLYLNGQYAGNYYLCAKVEIGEERLDITDLEEATASMNKIDKLKNYLDYETENKKAKVLEHNPEDITGGYLIEREFQKRFDEERDTHPSSFTTANQENFMVQSPCYCSKEQIVYISNLVQEAENAILSESGCNPDTGKSYTEYIDLDSFVKKYLVEEVSKNYDGGITSSYFYKDSDKVSSLLYAGPGWDYDVTWGNQADWSGNPMGVTQLAVHAEHTAWFDALYEKEEFNRLMKTYYKDIVSPYLQELTATGIRQLWEKVESSARMDAIRWQTMQEQQTLEQSIGDLCEFIDNRRAFLDDVWTEGAQYCAVTFLNGEDIYHIEYVKTGTPIEKLPELYIGDYMIENWYRQLTDETIQVGEVIHEDMICYCKPEEAGE